MGWTKTYIICPNVDFENLVFFAEIHDLNELKFEFDWDCLAVVEYWAAIGASFVVRCKKIRYQNTFRR